MAKTTKILVVEDEPDFNQLLCHVLKENGYQVQAATKQIEALIALRPRKPIAGTLRRPPAKPTTGLPAPLARRIEHGDD